MTETRRYWPVAAATHAARDAIPAAPTGVAMWPGMASFLKWTKRTGFDGVDLSDSVVSFDQPGCTGLAELRRATEDEGLGFGGLNLLRCSLADPGHGEANVDRVRRSIEACAILDAGIVSISLAIPRAVDDCNKYRGLDYALGGSHEATDADFKATGQRLRSLAAEAAGSGVRLSVEVHHASLADNSAATLRLLELAGGDVGANPDLINGYWAYCTPDEDWRTQLTRLAPVTNLWHVKNVQRVELEPDKRADYLGTTLADGDIDYRWACATMRQAGFTGWVSIERGGAGDALHTLSTSLTYLDELMQA